MGRPSTRGPRQRGRDPNTVRYTLPPVRRDTPAQEREKAEKIQQFLERRRKAKEPPRDKP